jgi:hypothetical protein
MEGIIDLLMNSGVSIVIIGLFIYVFFEDRKDRKEEKANSTQLLGELTKAVDNTAKSLELLTMSTEKNQAELREHDKKAMQEFGDIKTELVKIEEKIDKE